MLPREERSDMDYWLKAFGFGARRRRLRDDWKMERNGLLLEYATFPRLPRIRTGDGIVYYAAGHGVVFAAGTATSLPFLATDDDSAWPYRVRVSLQHALDFVHDGEPLENISTRRALQLSIRQQSHIRLDVEEYEAAIRALEGRGATGA
jgi:hypothetical protein